MSSPLDHSYIERFGVVLGMAWFGLLVAYPIVWAFVTLTAIILAAGFFVSRFVFGIHGWAMLTLSSVGCGSVIVLAVWLLFRTMGRG